MEWVCGFGRDTVGITTASALIENEFLVKERDREVYIG